MPDIIKKTFLQAVRLEREKVTNFKSYPFSIPSVRHLHRLEFHPAVTFFIGENGTGKSTLLEAIATRYGFNAEGGSKNFNFRASVPEGSRLTARQQPEPTAEWTGKPN
jgi:predicted ATPase